MRSIMTISFNSSSAILSSILNNQTLNPADSAPPPSADNNQTDSLTPKNTTPPSSASAHNSLALKVFSQNEGLSQNAHVSEQNREAPAMPQAEASADFFDWFPGPIPTTPPQVLPTPNIPAPINWDDIFGPGTHPLDPTISDPLPIPVIPEPISWDDVFDS